MRAFLKRFATPIVIGVAALLALSALAIGVSLLRHGHPASANSGANLSRKAVDIYAGLGAWVDLWDTRAWRDPAAAVDDMASHGVHTLYIETGTSKTPNDVAVPDKMRSFITAAHAHNMYVVAWYLPNLKSGSVDFSRTMKTVAFSTGDGQRFDSVALDIESTAVKPFAKRNGNLATLSEQVRGQVGASYPLGAIIPSPEGLTRKTGFWDVFPYATVGTYYNVLLPMAYYTYHGHTAAQARADVAANMRILRAQPGCATIPVHLIGGLANASSAGAALAFSQGAKNAGCIGASIYDWVGTNDAKWRALTPLWGNAAK